MKQAAFIIYTLFCLALGSLFFQDASSAGGGFGTQHYSVYELGTPPGGAYRACLGVSLKNGATKKNVIVDWKSDENFVIFIKE